MASCATRETPEIPTGRWASAEVIAQPTQPELAEALLRPSRLRGILERSDHPAMTGGGLVAASRIFSGRDQYPPRGFAAYGVLAFRSWASPENLSRHLMICNAYVSGLPRAYDLEVPRSAQMVTVWPIDSDAEAANLNREPRNMVCDSAVKHYGLVTSLQALKEAEFAGADISGKGPFLLAWSPGYRKQSQTLDQRMEHREDTDGNPPLGRRIWP